MGRGRPRKNANQEVVATKTTKKVTTPAEKTKENIKEEVVEKVEKPVTKPEKIELTDNEEIDIVALDSNIYYWDRTTDETYEWHEVGDVISLPFSVIKNMWRNHKNYFRNFLLKPLDERVIEKLGLTKVYDKYDFLNDGTQYTRGNIDYILSVIKGTTNSFQTSICNNIKNMIIDGEITDVYVINTLGRYFNVDFITLLD